MCKNCGCNKPDEYSRISADDVEEIASELTTLMEEKVKARKDQSGCSAFEMKMIISAMEFDLQNTLLWMHDIYTQGPEHSKNCTGECCSNDNDVEEPKSSE